MPIGKGWLLYRYGPLALVDLMAEAFAGGEKTFPVTYAGGIGNFDDLEAVRRHGKGCVDLTIGSALDLFGGSMPYREVLKRCDMQESDTQKEQ